jgi:hypothetical protein
MQVSSQCGLIVCMQVSSQCGLIVCVQVSSQCGLYAGQQLCSLSVRQMQYFSIQPRTPQISISLDHCNPALAGENYVVTVNVVNEETVSISDLDIEVSLPEFLDKTQPYSE